MSVDDSPSIEIICSERSEYEGFIGSKPIVVIHFRAEWNRDLDSKQRENITRVDPNYGYDVRFGAVDIDREDFLDIARSVTIKKVPSLVYYKDGKHIETVTGLCSKDVIETKLNQLLKLDNFHLDESTN